MLQAFLDSMASLRFECPPLFVITVALLVVCLPALVSVLLTSTSPQRVLVASSLPLSAESVSEPELDDVLARALEERPEAEDPGSDSFTGEVCDT